MSSFSDALPWSAMVWQKGGLMHLCDISYQASNQIVDFYDKLMEPCSTLAFWYSENSSEVKSFNPDQSAGTDLNLILFA